MPVTLRPVTSEDEEFLLKLYSTVRAKELAQVPWSDLQKDAFLSMQFAAQQLHYKQHNPTATHDIILLDGLAIGRLYVARREREIRILDITILREHRSKGFWTALRKHVIVEATRPR